MNHLKAEGGQRHHSQRCGYIGYIEMVKARIPTKLADTGGYSLQYWRQKLNKAQSTCPVWQGGADG